MANEFIIKNGYVSKGDSQVSGSLNVGTTANQGILTVTGKTNPQLQFLNTSTAYPGIVTTDFYNNSTDNASPLQVQPGSNTGIGRGSTLTLGGGLNSNLSGGQGGDVRIIGGAAANTSREIGEIFISGSLIQMAGPVSGSEFSGSFSGSFTGAIGGSETTVVAKEIVAGTGTTTIDDSIHTTGAITASGQISSSSTIIGNSFVKSGGTSAQFLKADGSVDSNTYSTATGVENNADVTDATNVTAAGALMDSEVTNLSFVKGLAGGISEGNVFVATADVADNDFLRVDGTSVEGLTAAEVRTAINVEDGADVTDATNVTAAGALMDSEVDADIKTLSLPANTTITSTAKSLLDDSSVSDMRTTLGLGALATAGSVTVDQMNSTTLITSAETFEDSDDTKIPTVRAVIGAGYTSNTGTVTSVGGTGTVSGLTLTGTVTTSGNLTLGGTLSVDLTSDVTGVLPSANMDSDTAHLTGTQTFSGAKTFSSGITISGNNYIQFCRIISWRRRRN